MPGRTIETIAVATTSAFAGAALLTQTVIVPGWRAMDPTDFLARFPVAGPVTGATVFPFEIASVLLLGVATYSAVRNSRPGRLAWALATSAMVATLVLVPLYFLRANLALLDPTFPPDAVPAALAAWYRWNWIRTGLGLVAAALACTALIAGRGEHTPPARSRDSP